MSEPRYPGGGESPPSPAGTGHWPDFRRADVPDPYPPFDIYRQDAFRSPDAARSLPPTLEQPAFPAYRAASYDASPYDVSTYDPASHGVAPTDPWAAPQFPPPEGTPAGQPGEWGVPGPWQVAPRRPVSHATGAALATVFLCFPLGAVALYQALQVDRRFDRGDVEGARRASDRAGAWLVWAVAMGLAWIALIVLYFLTRR